VRTWVCVVDDAEGLRRVRDIKGAILIQKGVADCIYQLPPLRVQAGHRHNRRTADEKINKFFKQLVVVIQTDDRQALHLTLFELVYRLHLTIGSVTTSREAIQLYGTLSRKSFVRKSRESNLFGDSGHSAEQINCFMI